MFGVDSCRGGTELALAVLASIAMLENAKRSVRSFFDTHVSPGVLHHGNDMGTSPEIHADTTGLCGRTDSKVLNKAILQLCYPSSKVSSSIPDTASAYFRN